MGEATGLAKGLRRQFGVEPDLDICGKRGATVVLPRPQAIEPGRIETTIDRATYTLTALHVRTRGTIHARDGGHTFVVAGTGQTAEIRQPDVPSAWLGHEVEAVTSWVGWHDGNAWIDAVLVPGSTE